MYKSLLVSILLFVFMYSCSDSKNRNQMSEEELRKTDEFMRKSDSLRMERLKLMHKNFVGQHRHKKNLAVHAHQNVPAKRQRMKSSARIKNRKNEQLKTQKAAQIEILKSKGLYKEEDENN